jgi:hypothetical protein
MSRFARCLSTTQPHSTNLPIKWGRWAAGLLQRQITRGKGGCFVSSLFKILSNLKPKPSFLHACFIHVLKKNVEVHYGWPGSPALIRGNTRRPTSDPRSLGRVTVKTLAGGEKIPALQCTTGMPSNLVLRSRCDKRRRGPVDSGTP